MREKMGNIFTARENTSGHAEGVSIEIVFHQHFGGTLRSAVGNPREPTEMQFAFATFAATPDAPLEFTSTRIWL
jgi:hypothetical protein